MNEDLAQLDADLKNLFIENKLEEMNGLLQGQPDTVVKELSEYSWNIIKKYYDTERSDLLLAHLRFVAYTCYLVEYAHRIHLISEEAFSIMMLVYQDIHELVKQQG